MKHLVLTLTLLTSMAATANTITTFDCLTDKVIEGKVPTRIQFQVENLDTNEAGYHVEKDEDYPVTMTPEDSQLMLNENFMIKQKADRLVMVSDGDGFQWTTFALFKNSGYKKGFARVEMADDRDTSLYSTVTCQVSR